MGKFDASVLASVGVVKYVYIPSEHYPSDVPSRGASPSSKILKRCRVDDLHAYVLRRTVVGLRCWCTLRRRSPRSRSPHSRSPRSRSTTSRPQRTRCPHSLRAFRRAAAARTRNDCSALTSGAIRAVSPYFDCAPTCLSLPHHGGRYGQKLYTTPWGTCMLV